MKDWGEKDKDKDKEMNRKNEGKEKRNVMGWRKTKKDINGNDFQGEKERFKERKWKCMSRMFVGKEREMQIGNEWMNDDLKQTTNQPTNINNDHNENWMKTTKSKRK